MTDQPTEPTQQHAEEPAETEQDLDVDHERDDTTNVVLGDVNVTGQDNRDDEDTQESDAVDQPPTDG